MAQIPIFKAKTVKLRYFIFIFSVLLTIIVNQAIIQYDINLQNEDAQLINLAGRQRMLSQRIAKRVLYLQNEFERGASPKHISANLDTIARLSEEFARVHEVLLKGSPEQGLKGINSPEINVLLAENTARVEAMAGACKAIVQNPSKATVDSAMRVIEQHELSFLLTMEATVKTFVQESQNKIRHLKNVEWVLAALAIGLLLLEFWLILRPLIRQLSKANSFLKEQNASLEEAKEELETLSHQLGRQNKQLLSFAHITSHNLRSPVSNLNSLLYFYKTSPSEEEKEMLFEKFEIVVAHLGSTLEELIETLKIQEDTEIAREELYFEDVFEKTKEILAGTILESSASIGADFSAAPKLSYPRTYLESIFLNLLSNAIKYRSPERPPIIKIETKVVDRTVVLSVKDNGLGIDLAQHGHKLFGLRKTFHRHAEAKGLGLFITKTQVEALGGSIKVQSAVNEGTTFEVFFNLKS